jgi:hypothetical protein
MDQVFAMSGNQYVTTSEVRNVTNNIVLLLYVYRERRLLHSTMSNTMVLTAGKYHCRGKGTVSMSTDQVYSRTPELMEHQHYHFLTCHAGLWASMTIPFARMDSG